MRQVAGRHSVPITTTTTHSVPVAVCNCRCLGSAGHATTTSRRTTNDPAMVVMKCPADDRRLDCTWAPLAQTAAAAVSLAITAKERERTNQWT